MSTIMPEGELVRRAVKWICEQTGGEGQIPAAKTIEEAAARFNLGPLDHEALVRFFCQQTEGGGGPA